MKLTDLMDINGLCMGVTLKEKDGVIDILVALQQKCGNTQNSKLLKQDIYYREEEASSVVGAGVAICHLHSNAVKKPMITAVTVPNGVDLEAPDGEKSKLVFLVVLPPETEDPATRLTVLLMNEDLREQLISAADEETFLKLLQLAEEGDYGVELKGSREQPLILAVFDTADRTAEAAAQLQQAAGKAGKLLKVELPGAENTVTFTKQDLQEAQGVILVGYGLQSCRFNGKPLLQVLLSDCIYRPEHLLNTVVQAPIYHTPVLQKVKKARLSGCFFRARVPLLPLLILAGGVFLLFSHMLQYWQAPPHLANAFRFMGEGALLPVLPLISGTIAFRYARWQGLAVGLAGGLLLANICGGAWVALLGGATAGLLMRACKKFGCQKRQYAKICNWVAPIFGIGTLGGLAYVINWLAAWLGDLLLWFKDLVPNQLLHGFILGGFSAADPGGPLSKAAQTAGESSTSVAVAGLALAIGVTLFVLVHYKKLDPVHRANGWVALPMALSGIPNGYTAFICGDPLRVFFPLLLGGGVAGLLAAYFGCTAEQSGVLYMLNNNTGWLLFLSAFIGGAVCFSLLFWSVRTTKTCIHEVKKSSNIF